MSATTFTATFPTLFAAATSLTNEQLAARANKSAFDEDADMADANVLALGLLKTARFRHLNHNLPTATTKTTAPPRALASLEKVLTRAAKDVLETTPEAAAREWSAFVQLATPVEDLCPTIWRALGMMSERQLTTNANKTTPIKAVQGDAANAKERLMLTLARRCNAASAPAGTRKELNAAAQRVLESSPQKQVAHEWEAYLLRCSILHSEYVGDVAESGTAVRRALFVDPEPEPEPEPVVQPADLCPSVWAALDTMTAVQLGNVANRLAPVPNVDAAGDVDCSCSYGHCTGCDVDRSMISTLKAKVLLTMAYRKVTDPTTSKCIYAEGQRALRKLKAGVVRSEWKAYLRHAHRVYADYLGTADAKAHPKVHSNVPAADVETACKTPSVTTVPGKHASSSKRAQLLGAACAVVLAYGSMLTMTMMGQEEGGEVFTP